MSCLLVLCAEPVHGRCAVRLIDLDTDGAAAELGGGF
jgi:hypothetical protein